MTDIRQIYKISKPAGHSKLRTCVLRIYKISEHARVPIRGSPGSAGLDLYSAVDLVIPCASRALVSIGLAIQCPDGTYGRIAPRSGLAVYNGIQVGAGVIDSDYRGNISVLLWNFGDSPFSVCRGDRIAQLILEKIEMPEVEVVSILEDTIRNTGAFGSTGSN